MDKSARQVNRNFNQLKEAKVMILYIARKVESKWPRLMWGFNPHPNLIIRAIISQLRWAILMSEREPF